MRRKHHISVKGSDIPDPVESFSSLLERWHEIMVLSLFCFSIHFVVALFVFKLVSAIKVTAKELDKLQTSPCDFTASITL